MSPPDADRQRIAAALAGDREAASALLEELSPVVRGVARRLCHDPQDIDDAVQHAFEALFRTALARWRGEGSLRAYTATVAANRIRGLLKKRRSDAWHLRLSAAPEDPLDPLDAVEDPGASPEQWARLLELVADLDAFLQKLTDQQREIFSLHVFQQLSPAETALVLDTSPEVVRTTLLRLRRRLAPSLHDRPAPPEEI